MVLNRQDAATSTAGPAGPLRSDAQALSQTKIDAIGLNWGIQPVDVDPARTVRERTEWPVNRAGCKPSNTLGKAAAWLRK